VCDAFLYFKITKVPEYEENFFYGFRIDGITIRWKEDVKCKEKGVYEISIVDVNGLENKKCRVKF